MSELHLLVSSLNNNLEHNWLLVWVLVCQGQGTSSSVTLRMKSQHEGALTPQLHRLEKPAGSKYNSTSVLSTRFLTSVTLYAMELD